MENSSDHHHHKQRNPSPPVEAGEREQEQDQGQECKLQVSSIIKVESCDDNTKMSGGDDVTKMNGGDDDGVEDGFKTPTKTEHLLKVDLHCPPPAPMKPKSQLMKRRRPTRRPLFQVSPQDFELMFSPNSSPSSSSSSVLLKDDIKKVNAPTTTPTNNNNLTTLMSFR